MPTDSPPPATAPRTRGCASTPHQDHRAPLRSLRARALAPACVVLALVAGCQTFIKTGADGRWVGIAPGGSLTLHRPVTMPQGRTRVFFVNGRVRRGSATYGTSCALEVRRIDRDGPRTIAPDRFGVTRVQPYWTEFAAATHAAAPRLRLAGQDGGDGGDGNAMIRTGYRFDLEGENPDVRRLTCLGPLDDPAFAYPPTLEEIDAALGSIATLDTSGSAD